jgi:PAS domain-containing protein
MHNVTLKFWIAAGALVLAAYAALFFWQVESAQLRAGENFLERQLWLARQSARFIELQSAVEPTGLPQVVERLAFTEGAIAQSRVALFDRQAQQFVALAPTIDFTASATLSRRLVSGGHGHLRVNIESRDWLVTYLPLSGEYASLTLVLAAPQELVTSPVKSLARAQALTLAALLILLGFGGAHLWRKPGAVPQQLLPAQDRDDSDDLVSLQNQCRALAQENALLGAARREYQFLVEGADYGLARLNSNGLILFCSRPFLNITGRERKELLGRNLLDLELFDCNLGRLHQAMARLRQGQIPQPLPCRLKSDSLSATEVVLRFSTLQVEGDTTGFLVQLHRRQKAAPHLSASLS